MADSNRNPNMAAAAPIDLSFDGEIEKITNVAGAFGSGVRFASFVLDNRHTEQDQFASTVIYGTVTVTDGERGLRRHQLVIKLKHRCPDLRAFFKTDLHFRNEIVFYERIGSFLSGPVLGDNDRAPPIARYIYGRNDCGDHSHRDMIIFENASTHGYRSAQRVHRLYLDLDHVTVALRTLAK